MKDLVEYLVKQLVSHPEAVVITESGDQQGTIYEVQVDPSDVGKVIGKGGKTVNSLRALVKAAASKTHERASVELLAD
ncbi:MAG TPA: KH domain-containing protein [Armatimonadota bacterium]|nr:KH domain-containing protein [Armatimonadota bacterium]